MLLTSASLCHAQLVFIPSLYKLLTLFLSPFPRHSFYRLRRKRVLVLSDLHRCLLSRLRTRLPLQLRQRVLRGTVRPCVWPTRRIGRHRQRCCTIAACQHERTWSTGRIGYVIALHTPLICCWISVDLRLGLDLIAFQRTQNLPAPRTAFNLSSFIKQTCSHCRFIS